MLLYFLVQSTITNWELFSAYIMWNFMQLSTVLLIHEIAFHFSLWKAKGSFFFVGSSSSIIDGTIVSQS